MPWVLSQPRMTMSIVELTTLQVGQDLIGLRARLELAFCFGVSRVTVGGATSSQGADTPA